MEGTSPAPAEKAACKLIRRTRQVALASSPPRKRSAFGGRGSGKTGTVPAREHVHTGVSIASTPGVEDRAACTIMAARRLWVALRLSDWTN